MATSETKQSRKRSLGAHPLSVALSVVIENKSSFPLWVAVSHQPFDALNTFKAGAVATVPISGGAAQVGVEYGSEVRTREPQPQKLMVPPFDTQTFPINKGTKRLFYTILVPHGEKSCVIKDSIQWPMQTRNLGFKRTVKEFGALTIELGDVVWGGPQIDVQLVQPISPACPELIPDY